MSEGAHGQNIGHSKRPLPVGWRWVRLGEACDLNPRRPSDLERTYDALTTFVPMSAVDERHGAIVRAELRPFVEVQKGYTYFAEGDVLFAKITPCMQNGKHAIARGLIDGIGFGSTEFHIIRPRSEIIAEWLHQFLRQPSVLLAATAHFSGTVGQQRVPDEYLRTLELPLPPLAMQQRVVAILNEQMAAVERARSAAEARLEAAIGLPAAYLRCVFPCPGEALTAGWQWVRILDIADRLPTGVQYERLTCQPKGDVPVVDQSEDDYIGFHNNEPGVLASEDQPVVTFANHTCAVRLHTTPFSTIQNVFPLRGKAGTDTHFLYWLLKNRIAASFYGGHWPKLEKEDLPLPPGNEQYRIADRLSRQMALVKQAHKALEVELASIDTLPAALLRRAFNGEL